jgi:HK97 gp10 family phage protein
VAEIHQWRGFRELEQNLLQLGAEVHERGVKRMMSRAAVPMRDDAKRRAPVLKAPDARRTPGTVRDAIKIWRKRVTRYAVTYYVGVRGLSRKAVRTFKGENKGKSSADNSRDPFYWRFVELGVPSRGIAPRPFLRQAFEAQKMEAVRVALDEGRAFIRRIRFKRLRGKVGL